MTTGMPNYPSLQGRVALVTGAARGIGLSVARLLSENGVTVVGLDVQSHSEEDDSSFVDVVDSGSLITGDVSNPRAVQQALKEAREYGCVSIVVNNAAVNGNGDVGSIDLETWRRTFAVNVEGIYHVCRQTLPQMAIEGDGRVVNISSVASMMAYPMAADYASTKGAINSLTRQLASDYSPKGVRVNAVAPGFIRTEMNADRWRDNGSNNSSMDSIDEQTLMPYLGKPSDVGHLILFLVSDAARFITGQVVPVDGGWSV